MHKQLLSFLFGAGACMAQAQNLVPNPSFEEFTTCPDAFGEVESVAGWTSIAATPDYFNACADTFLVAVPDNAFGYQPASDGQAYLGCYTYRTGPTVREQMQAPLLAPLQSGQVLYVSMRVAPGGFGRHENWNMHFTARGIGMHFSTQPLAPGLHITNNAALFSEEVLTDTLQWTVLSGTYLADSAYAYIQIGNFFDDVNSDPTVLDPDGTIDGAYAFVDAVCVSTVPGVCDRSSSMTSEEAERLHPSGSIIGGELQLLLPGASGSQVHGILIDAAGRVCWGGLLHNIGQAFRVDMGRFAPGLYNLLFTTQSGAQATWKFAFTP